MSKLTVFVTGGTGKIGRSLVKRLLADGFLVRVLSRRGVDDWKGNNEVTLIKGDLLDRKAVRFGMEGCRYVCHLAAYQNINDPNYDHFGSINVNGTKNIFETAKCLSVKKIIYLSTVMVFEETKSGIGDENWEQKRFCEGDHYARSKIEALAYVRSMKSSCPVVVLYPTSVIDLDHFSSSAPVNAGWKRKLWEYVGCGVPGGILSLIGSADRVINYVVIDDLVDGIIKAILKGAPGEEFILGGDNITVGEYLRSATARVNRKAFFLRIPLFPFKFIARFKDLLPIPGIILVLAKYGDKNMNFTSQKAGRMLDYHPKSRIN